MRYYKEKTIETEEQKSEGANGSTPKAVPKVVWVRKFKGSIFVVFKTPEQAKKLLAEEINFMGNVIVSYPNTNNNFSVSMRFVWILFSTYCIDFLFVF